MIPAYTIAALTVLALFLLHTQGEAELEILRQLFPSGNDTLGTSKMERPEFVLFWIPEGASTQ